MLPVQKFASHACTKDTMNSGSIIWITSKFNLIGQINCAVQGSFTDYVYSKIWQVSLCKAVNQGEGVEKGKKSVTIVC